MQKARISVMAPGELQEDLYKQFSLSSQIKYFLENENIATRFPVQNFHQMSLKYLDKMQLLGFAYASLYPNLMGNITELSSTYMDKNLVHYVKRLGVIEYSEDIDYSDYHLRISNDFAKMKFVSCGSKGLEPFPFLEFVSVFDNNVWITLLAAIYTFTYAIKIITGKFWNNGGYTGLMGILKILLEQSNPFPNSLLHLFRYRCTLCGTFLAGLVISNAFKSENMYQIVMPRYELSYYNVDELLEDRFQLYTRIWYFWYELLFYQGSYDESSEHFIYVGFDGSWMAAAESEVYTKLFGEANQNSSASQVYNNAKLHPRALEVFTEPIQLLALLVKIGLINKNNSNVFKKGKAMMNRFWNDQNELILNDLITCNKSAWVIPDYIGQTVSRKLRKLGKHSDVGTNAYNKAYLIFRYEGLVPTSLLNKLLMIKESGILEWWPDFINRTDLKIGNDIVLPTSPNMFGNIQVVFFFLGGGLAISIACVGIELLETIFNFIKFYLKWCLLKCNLIISIIWPIMNRIRNIIIHIDVRGFNIVPL